jgi:hypothetical protein
MKPVPLFAIIWITASLLLIWLGDFNTYVTYPDGTSWVKNVAPVSERITLSVGIGCAFSALNMAFIRRWEKHQWAIPKT